MTTVFHTTLTSTLEYDPSVPCITDTVNEFLMSKEFRQHLDKGLEFAIEKVKVHGKIGWLANTQAMPSIAEDDLNWVLRDWMPRAAQAGVQYMATILPQDQIAQFTADYVMSEVDVASSNIQIQFRYFTDVLSAREWLVKSLRS